jgi:hypothetical protein
MDASIAAGMVWRWSVPNYLGVRENAGTLREMAKISASGDG